MSIFAIFVILGFLFQTLAAWGFPYPWLGRLAWLFWLVAAILWGIGYTDPLVISGGNGLHLR